MVVNEAEHIGQIDPCEVIWGAASSEGTGPNFAQGNPASGAMQNNGLLAMTKLFAPASGSSVEGRLRRCRSGILVPFLAQSGIVTDRAGGGLTSHFLVVLLVSALWKRVAMNRKQELRS